MLLYFFSCETVKICFTLAGGCWHCHFLLLCLRQEQVNLLELVEHLLCQKPLYFVPVLNLQGGLLGLCWRCKQLPVE